MAPIPVYTASPIVASKPDGVTPQTAQPPSAPSGEKPATSSASPTSTSQSSYPPAQPGAAPSLPAPTGTTYALPQPTQTFNYNGPPAPQPGAFPAPSGATRTHIPPPPKAGEKYQTPQQLTTPQPASMPYPQQMSIPTPTASYPSQQRGTSTAEAPNSYSLEHPPGYHQNANASEVDGYKRLATQQSELENQTDSSEGVWGTAKKWAQQTGEKLAAAENEVWKKISKD
ncbi:uncharacterized protein GGS25DRAFT_146319 [Hypoxylon fragiforme]|uniref:uncharacterized protein n=1 Tax=Hypoxylon fragiforme TaxID=63214 RepID=UPI0020C646F2|nr:uncharacterized protein GGS25DRAFT_146319 [Hypoxylon fragiforme]KAI2613019.1 hypothetical protein GGS25DRAFT_146319 [Hypoxylon fragiforme]